MFSVGRLVLRLVLVPIGYFVAIVTAVALISAVSMARAYGPVADDPALIGMTGMVVAGDALVLMWVLGGVAFLPALAAIALSETFAVRSWLYFAASAVVVAGVVEYLMAPEAPPGMPADIVTTIAAALAAGLGYWAVAGRDAGLRSRRA